MNVMPCFFDRVESLETSTQEAYSKNTYLKDTQSNFDQKQTLHLTQKWPQEYDLHVDHKDDTKNKNMKAYVSVIVLFRSITILCETNNISHIQYECGKCKELLCGILF